MGKMSVIIDGAAYDIELDLHRSFGSDLTVIVNGETLRVVVPELADPEQVELILIGGRPYEIVIDRNLGWIKSSHGIHRLELRDLEMPVVRPASGDGRVKAPIPGVIARVLVHVGDQVQAGQVLLVLEAMKMENQISAPRAGTVGQLNVAEGQNVALHALLAEIV